MAGFVPIEELQKLQSEKAKEAADMGEVEKELRHVQKNLEHQIILRDRMDREIAFLRAMQLAHKAEDSGIQKAVSKMEAITNQLQTMMQDTWPAAITEEAATTAP
jgi:hypothetical protein